METVVVTVKNRRQNRDLELPAQVPLAVLVPILARELNWGAPGRDTDSLSFSGRVARSQRQLQPDDTLAAAGVRHGDVVALTLRQPRPEKQESLAASSPAPSPQPEQVKGPHLRSEATGRAFSWRSRSAIAGRPDPPRRPPAIDLTDLDGAQKTSRRHAQIWRNQKGEYWIKDLRSTNGTIVDGRRLGSGRRARLQDGSRVQFGKGGPVLTFHLGI